LQTRNIHILHIHGARAALYGRLAVATLRPRPRVVFSVHGFATPFHAWPKRTLYLWLERALQHYTDLTICVAQAEADLFLSFGLTEPAKTVTIPYGIDIDRFAMSSTSGIHLRETLGVGPGPIILTVCRLNVPRDFVTLLTAFHRVLSELPLARLLIVGDGPQRGQVETLIDQLRLTHAVDITGFRNDIPALMLLADVYVLTSYGWEGYPISTLEAQAAGVPVVVTDAGGSREAVLHEKTGLIVPIRQPDALAGALLRLLGENELRQRMGEAGKKRAHREFGREQMTRKIADHYDDLSGRANREIT
jgi:glycosyltransferase involved in cell wall biosynthesis